MWSAKEMILTGIWIIRILLKRAKIVVAQISAGSRLQWKISSRFFLADR